MFAFRLLSPQRHTDCLLSLAQEKRTLSQRGCFSFFYVIRIGIYVGWYVRLGTTGIVVVVAFLHGEVCCFTGREHYDKQRVCFVSSGPRGLVRSDDGVLHHRQRPPRHLLCFFVLRTTEGRSEEGSERTPPDHLPVCFVLHILSAESLADHARRELIVHGHPVTSVLEFPGSSCS